MLTRLILLVFLIGTIHATRFKEKFSLSANDEIGGDLERPPEQLISTTDGDDATVAAGPTQSPFLVFSDKNAPEKDNDVKRDELDEVAGNQPTQPAEQDQDEDPLPTGQTTTGQTTTAQPTNKPIVQKPVDPLAAAFNLTISPAVENQAAEKAKQLEALVPQDLPLDVAAARLAALFNDTRKSVNAETQGDKLLFRNASLPGELPVDFTAPVNSTLDPSVLQDLQEGVGPNDLVALPKCNPGKPCNISALLSPELPPAKAIISQVGKLNDPNDEYVPPAEPVNKTPLVGRIRVFSLSDEDSEQTCVRETNMGGITLLATAPCAYSDDQMFVYDQTTSALYSKKSYEKKIPYRVLLDSFPADNVLSLTYVNGQRAVSPTAYQGTNAFVVWTIPTDSFNALAVDDKRPDTPERWCLMAPDTADAQPLSAVTIVNDTSVCSSFLFSHLSEDFVTGHILVTENSFRADRSRSYCVTYIPVGQKHSGPSRLSVELCAKPKDDLWKYQQFMYNTITYHLRAYFSQNIDWVRPYVGNPLLFFWWRGAIKHYFNFEEHIDGYGWRIPLNRAGAATVVDNRGYSGQCMTIRKSDMGIFASQKCHSFLMVPEKLPRFLRRTGNSARTYQAAHLRVRQPQGNNTVEKCMSIGRVVREYNGRKSGFIWQAQNDWCGGILSLNVRMMISVASDTPCTTDSCVGHIRWSGDPGNTLFLPQVRPVNIVRRTYIEPRAGEEGQVPYQWNLPFTRWAPITTTHKDQSLCLNYNEGFLVLVRYKDAKTDCASFYLQPIRQNIPRGVSLLQQFDSRSTFYMPSDPVIWAKKSSKARLEKTIDDNARHTANDLRFLQKYFDVYFADMGDFGDRRYRAVGHGASRSPSGQVTANRNGKRGGVYMPFFPHRRLLLDRFALITMRFVAIRKDIRLFGDPDQAFLLFSFMSTHGCTVYITTAGLPGVVCYKGNKVVAQCQGRRAVYEDGYLYNVLDGRPHIVALLFSHIKAGSIRLYLNNEEVLHCQNTEAWQIGLTSRSLWLFNQPGKWQYQALPAVLLRTSLYTSDDANALDALAEGRKQTDPPRPRRISMEAAGSIETEVRGCKEMLQSGDKQRVIGLKCKLYAFKRNTAISVPVTLFSLACSRPKCDVYFTQRSSQPFGHSHEFVYLPNYPGNFTSEDVGAPDLFPDFAQISDGFSTFNIKFGIQYDPTATVPAKIETESGSTIETESGSKIETESGNQVDSKAATGAADFMRYRCKASCCTEISGGRGQVAVVDDTF